MSTYSRQRKPQKEFTRKPNDGLTEATAHRLCVYCLAGECANANNDMYHLLGPDSTIELNPEFHEFIMKNKKQPVITKPINHLKQIDGKGKEEDEQTKTSNIPCQYCVIGKCTTWRTDTRFKHILGWYCPLNSEQISLLAELRNNQNIRRNKELLEKHDKLEQLIKSTIADRPDIAEVILKAVTTKETDEQQQQTDVSERKTPVHRIPISEILKFKDSPLVTEELK